MGFHHTDIHSVMEAHSVCEILVLYSAVAGGSAGSDGVCSVHVIS